MKEWFRFISDDPLLQNVLQLLLTAVLAFLLVVIGLKIFAKVMARNKNRKNNINIRFVEKIVRFLAIFVAVLWVVLSSELTKPLGQTLFQGTTVIAAIIGFASQPVLSDLMCGIMLSTTKPFDIGNRISMDNGMFGIVKDITLRHVVLQGMDSQVYVVPNSKMNGMIINNLSYHSDKRSCDFRFQVAYGTDTDLARKLILEAIKESPVSVPGKKGKDGGETYADVYFLSFGEYYLELGTTAYFLHTTPTEVFRNDINTRVKKTLEANHIEIPFRYMNVQFKDGAQAGHGGTAC